MSTWTPAGNFLIGQGIEEVSTTQKHQLGVIVQCKDATLGSAEFIYLKGVASTVVGSIVNYDDTWQTALDTAAVSGPSRPLAVAMAAVDATTKFGWYQISGKAVVKAGTVADNGNVYATGTPGTVDDAVVDGDMVHLAKFASADGTPSAGLAEIEIHRPYNDDITTND